MALGGIDKIISGGQTGVDRAGLDFAISRGLEHGGWCPKGRRAEDGIIPERYRMRECGNRAYHIRTQLNVIDSDGTLVFFRGRAAGGTLLTVKLCRKHAKALFCVDMDCLSELSFAGFSDWLHKNCVKVLNVAGPRQKTTEHEDALAALALMAEMAVEEQKNGNKKKRAKEARQGESRVLV